MKPQEFMKHLKTVMKTLDDELRENKCDKCGKPVAGIIPPELTAEEAGLCIGHEEKAEVEDE